MKNNTIGSRPLGIRALITLFWNRICIVAVVVVAVVLVGCSGGTAYYQLDRFASQKGEVIVEELESNQGFDYSATGAKHIDHLWAGVPKDAIEDCDGVVVYFEDENQEKVLSKEELEVGTNIGRATIYWTGEGLEHSSDASNRIDSIAKKCGFGSVIHEGYVSFPSDGWVRIGKCKLNGKDAYWGVGTDFDGRYCATVKLLGDKTYEELADGGVSLFSLMY